MFVIKDSAPIGPFKEQIPIYFFGVASGLDRAKVMQWINEIGGISNSDVGPLVTEVEIALMDRAISEYLPYRFIVTQASISVHRFD